MWPVAYFGSPERFVVEEILGYMSEEMREFIEALVVHLDKVPMKSLELLEWSNHVMLFCN